MKLGILIFVVLFEIVSIVICSLLIKRKERKAAEAAEGGFALAGRSFGVGALSTTLALTILGAAHIWGTMENAYMNGATACWTGIACVILLGLVTQGTGLTAKRLKVNTIPELFEKLFGSKARTVLACLQCGFIFNFMCLELQGLTFTFQVITGWPAATCAIISGAFGVLYIFIAGMKEIGTLNIVSCVIMYVGVIVAVIALGFNMPGGWGGVQENLIAAGKGNFLSVFDNPVGIISTSLPTVIGFVLFDGWSQFLLQPVIASKSEKVIRRSLWIAAPMNGLFCCFTAVIGIAALALPQFTDLGGVPGSQALLSTMLPDWAFLLLMLGFMGVLLSTFAMCAFGPATMFAYDIYGRLYNRKSTEKDKVKVIRIVIIVMTIFAVINSLNGVVVFTSVTWGFSMLFSCSVFVFFGLFWKRSTKAWAITTAINIAVNILWTFWLQEALHAELINVVYVSAIVAIGVGALLNAVMPGKPGMLKLMKERGEYPTKKKGVA